MPDLMLLGSRLVRTWWFWAFVLLALPNCGLDSSGIPCSPTEFCGDPCEGSECPQPCPDPNNPECNPGCPDPDNPDCTPTCPDPDNPDCAPPCPDPDNPACTPPPDMAWDPGPSPVSSA